MASAWGRAWGKAWGNAWGRIASTPTPAYLDPLSVAVQGVGFGPSAMAFQGFVGGPVSIFVASIWRTFIVVAEDRATSVPPNPRIIETLS